MNIIIDLERDDVTFTAEFWVTAIDPGVISGPPENCYPAEGGAEIENLKVTVFDKDYALSSTTGQEIELDPAKFPGVVDEMAQMAYADYLEQQEQYGEY